MVLTPYSERMDGPNDLKPTPISINFNSKHFRKKIYAFLIMTKNLDFLSIFDTSTRSADRTDGPNDLKPTPFLFFLDSEHFRKKNYAFLIMTKNLDF